MSSPDGESVVPGNTPPSGNDDTPPPGADDNLSKKRKREHDEESSEDEDGLFVPAEDSMAVVLYGSNLDQDDDSAAAESQGDFSDDNDTDDEAGDDVDEGQHIHMESSESFPECAIYDDDIPALKELMTSVPKKIVDILLPHDCDGKHVKTHLGSANSLMQVVPPKRLKVALIGNAGVGKSSTFNAVVDILNMAKSLSGGQSCTCVPTQFSCPFVGQKKPYAAIVKYYSLNGVRGLLAEYITDFNTDEFEQDPHWDQETRQLFHKRAVNALNTLQVLFRDREEFSTREAAREYLRLNYEDKSVNALQVMVNASVKKLRGKDSAHGPATEYREAPTRGKLREAIDPFMTAKSTGSESALWPLVRTVCIGVRGSRVLERLTIIDLPGISDTNETRVKLTREYVKACDYIWLVAPISRVIDDNVTADMVYRYGKPFRGRIAVISKLAKELRDEGQDVRAWYQLNDEFKALNNTIKKLEREAKHQRRLKRQTKQKMLDTVDKEDRVEVLKGELKGVDLRRFESLVQARNDWITAQLRINMDCYLPAGMTLQVHCISNSHYAAIKAGRSMRGLRLSPHATGVPALRAYALTLVAPGLLCNLEEYHNTKVGLLLKNAQLWVKTTNVERRAELLDLVLQPLNNLRGHIDARLDAFEKGIKGCLVDALHRQFEDNQKVAAKALDQKRSKHAATIMAFIRKNGNHQTSVCPKESWNEHFMQGVTVFISENWEAFESSKAQITDHLRDTLIKDMRGILPAIEDEHPLSSHVLPMHRLRELVNVQVGALNDLFRGNAYPYSQDLRNIQIVATQDSDKNYFSRTMKPIYDNCKLDTGAGITKRSLAKIEAHLSKPQRESPFTRVERALTAALIKNDAKHVKDGVESIEGLARDIFTSLYNAFDRLVDKTVEDPRERRAREALQEELLTLEEWYEEAGQKLEEVKERYTC
ncbi:hypothetical protein LTR53_011253 [Teratosphaeriaceae sp. CCFEE 6253]|nr:hypothetical protein LTR53_011253 [Teratosphaeriaceae sp. CCFEE 6253]